MKSCYIVRGLPGSGKTSFAQNLIVRCQDKVKVTHIEADQFMMVGNEYKFKAEKLVENHKKCYLRFIQTCEHQRMGDIPSLLIVANTSLACWEYAPYYRHAEAMNWDVRIVTIDCPSDVAYHRQVHDVPYEKFQQMVETFKKGTQDVPKFWIHELVKTD